MKRALITGVNGQDGSYLAEILLEQGYEVHGVHRHSSVENHLWRVSHLPNLHIHEADVTDAMAIRKVIAEVYPDELYHEADQDHVGYSKATPSYSVAVTVGGAVNVLESVRAIVPECRVFLPCSATMFRPSSLPLSLNSDLMPDSPYACAKAHVYHLGRYYCREYGMYVVCGVLFNHDSPRRGPSYLLQRIARAAAANKPITLTDPDYCVEVGYAKEYMECAVKSLQKDSPQNYIIGSGVPYSIGGLAMAAYCRAGSSVGLIGYHYSEDSASIQYQQFIADVFHTYHKLGWQAKADAMEMVVKLVDHYRKSKKHHMDSPHHHIDQRVR